jgi:cytochrome o ubiquinol oxidase operon protein cyoD
MPSLKSYLAGFISSVVLTLAAYFAVVNHVHNALVIILSLAVIQVVIQLIFFLHLGKGQDASWNLVVFFSTFTIILILVIGSIWIMGHLNYNMTPQDIQNYMNDQSGGV